MVDTFNIQKPVRYGFLTVPSYSMIAFSSAIEALRLANRESGRTLYQWITYTLDGEPVAASNGLYVGPDMAISEARNLDGLFVCGGINVEKAHSKTLMQWLRKLAQGCSVLGALCEGSYLLARAGLLDGYRCAIHYEKQAGMRESFPKVVVSSDLFEVDRNRYTSAGGIGSLDMMLQLIAKTHGQVLAATIAEQFLCERLRGERERQRIPLRIHLGTSQPKLMEAVAIMEANLEEPVSLDELARYVGVSRRQLERLFQKYLHCVPRRYYLELRLNQARKLLLQTNMSIVDVALACGFVSAPHFSKCYRAYFAKPPRDERHMRRKDSPAADAGM